MISRSFFTDQNDCRKFSGLDSVLFGVWIRGFEKSVVKTNTLGAVHLLMSDAWDQASEVLMTQK